MKKFLVVCQFFECLDRSIVNFIIIKNKNKMNHVIFCLSILLTTILGQDVSDDFDLVEDLVNDLVPEAPPLERVQCFSCLQIRSERVGMFGNCNSRDAWQVRCSSGTCGTFRITRSIRESLTNRLLDIGIAIAESIPAIPYIREIRRLNGLNATVLIKGCFSQQICDFTERIDARDTLNLANIRCRLCQGELCNSGGIINVPNAVERRNGDPLRVAESTDVEVTSGARKPNFSEHLNALMVVVVILFSIVNKI